MSSIEAAYDVDFQDDHRLNGLNDTWKWDDTSKQFYKEIKGE